MFRYIFHILSELKVIRIRLVAEFCCDVGLFHLSWQIDLEVCTDSF